MTQSSKFVANSVEQILLGLARGLRDAQAVLDDLPPTDAFGRPQPGYHLPYLDFNIKATVQAQLDAAEASSGMSVLPGTLRKARPIPQLQLALPNPKKAPSEASGNTELISTFSGRLVSVPPSNALPVLRLAARSLVKKPAKPREQQLLVTLSNSAGQLISDAAVELNLDIDASLALSEAAGANGLTAEQLRSGLQLGSRLLLTDQQGSASCDLTLAAGLPASTQLVLLVSSGATLTQLILTP